MSDVVFTPQPTPNPNAYKFVANRTIHEGPALSFYSAEAAHANPAASQLFAIPGVTGVMILSNFCSVNQDGQRRWAELIPQIESVLDKAFK